MVMSVCFDNLKLLWQFLCPDLGDQSPSVLEELTRRHVVVKNPSFISEAKMEGNNALISEDQETGTITPVPEKFEGRGRSRP
jgi:hypothetical protein